MNIDRDQDRIEKLLARAKHDGFNQMLSNPAIALLMSAIPPQHSEAMKALMKQSFSNGVDQGVAVFVLDVVTRMVERQTR